MKPRSASHPRSGHVRRSAAWRAAGERNIGRLGDRVSAARERHRSVALVFAMVERDSDIGGRIIAGALAYRLFIWLLPLGLVAVSGLGIAADAAAETPSAAAKSLGVAGIVTASVTSAANASRRWYALLIGFPVLVAA